VGTDDVSTDEDLRLSVRRALGGSVLVVVLVAAMFWAIGSVGSDDELVVAADELEAADAADASADEPDPPAEERAPQPEPEPDPEEPEPQPDPDPDADPDTESDADAEPDAEPDEEAPVDDIDPGDVTVQVLDGLRDGGSAAAGVADELESVGYRIVAQNPAILSDVTAVLWTAGNEEAARQVAAAIGAEEVRRQPGTLSDSVAVHVVVGADRG
jgi:hypothetical protein